MDHLLPSPGTHFTRQSQALESGLAWHSRLDTNVHFWQEWKLKLVSPVLPLLLSMSLRE